MAVEEEVYLHPGQAAAWNADCRFVALIAGTGGGKTWTGPLWLYNEISKYPEDKWLVVAPTYKMLRRATLPELIQRFGGTPLEGVYKEVKGEYVLPDGSIIYLCSADKPNALEGGQFRGAWLDEAGQMKRWTWVVTQARLGLKQGRCLITTTPYGQNWLYQEFYKPAKKVLVNKAGEVIVTGEGLDPNYFCVQYASDINPYYPTDEVSRMRNVLNEKEFSMRYLGTFETLAGLVYPGLSSCIVDHDPYKIKDGDLKIGGLDPGYSEEFAGITAIYGADEKLHLRRELYETKVLMRDVASALDRSTDYYIDPHARREMEELLTLGLRVYQGFSDVRPGIMKVNEFIADGKIVITEDAFPNMIDEASTYTFAENKDEPDERTPHHLLDALRYMIMGLVDNSKLEIFFV